MTGQEIIDRAWVLVQDTETTKRNPVSALVPMLNDGIRDLLARRPGLALDDDGALETFTDLTTETVATTALRIGEEYREALAHYLGGRVFEMDADDEHNAGLAQYHAALYLRNS